MRMHDTLAKQRPGRRATNVSLSRDCLAEARELEINISQACERGLRETIAEARGERWLRENRKALDSYNSHIEKHGLPLEELRLF